MTVLTLARVADIDWRWVKAAPFRAQVRQLLAETGLPWRALAGAAGIPDRVVHRLLYGRDSRAVRRIAPHYAHRLLRMTGSDLSALLEELTTAESSCTAAHQLLGSQWTIAQIATVAELTELETEALLTGRASCVPWRVQLLLSAAVRAHRLDTDERCPFLAESAPTAA